MEVVIEKLDPADILKTTKLLKNSKALLPHNLTRGVIDHIINGTALKLVVDGNIEGVWCSKDIGEFTSLSYFYISPKMRGTLWVLKLFKFGLELVDPNKPILVETADTTGFDKYFEHIEGNTYLFKGLR